MVCASQTAPGGKAVTASTWCSMAGTTSGKLWKSVSSAASGRSVGEAAVLRSARVGGHLAAGDLGQHLTAQADTEQWHALLQRLREQGPGRGQPRRTVVVARQEAAAQHDHGIVRQSGR